MTGNSFPFPMYSGLLEPQHYERIGNAIWLFLWCISATTKDVIRDEETWGVVLGNKPVEIDDLASRFGVNRSTIKRWIGTLQEFDYIRTKRAPYGTIIAVRNSKKFSEKRSIKNAPSQVGDGANIGHPEGNFAPSNKDITEDIKDVVIKDPAEIMRLAVEVEKHFVGKRGKGFNVSTNDFVEIKNLVATGIPLEIVKDSIDKSFAEYKPQHARDEIRNMAYCIPRCFNEWERSKVKPITGAVPHVLVALGGSSKRTKQQQELDDLRRRAKEEQQRE